MKLLAGVVSSAVALVALAAITFGTPQQKPVAVSLGDPIPDCVLFPPCDATPPNQGGGGN
jgi:hypothetical protein